MAKEDFGIFSLLYAFIPVVSTVASLGLEQVLRRYQPEYLNSGRTAAAAWLVRVVASGRFLTNILVLAVVLLAWNYIAPIFKLVSYKSIFAIFCVLILVHFQARILQLALASLMLHRYSVGSMAVLSFIKLVVYGLLVWHGSLTLLNAILADIAAYIVAYVFLRTAYQRYLRAQSSSETEEHRPTPEEKKRLVRYGILNNFNDAGVLLLYSTIDNFFIAALIDTVSVGIYAFYSRLHGMVINVLPMKLFDNIVQPLFFATQSAEADRKIPQYFTFLINMNLLVQWPVVAFSTAYHAEIVQVIFGGKFIEHSWLLPMITGFGIFTAMADPASLVAQYEEKAGILLLSKLFAVYNILAMIVLVPIMGIYGATLAAGTAQAMKNLFIWWNVRNRAIWINGRAALCCGIGLWGLVVVTCYGVKAIAPLPDLAQLCIGVVVFTAAMLVFVRTPAIASSDRYMLGSLAPGKVAHFLRRFGLLPATEGTAR